jgi:hypothetical protein
MHIDKEIRERLKAYQVITKQTQEKVVNQAIAEMLKRLDRAMKPRMNKVKALRAALLGL